MTTKEKLQGLATELGEVAEDYIEHADDADGDMERYLIDEDLRTLIIQLQELRHEIAGPDTELDDPLAE